MNTLEEQPSTYSTYFREDTNKCIGRCYYVFLVGSAIQYCDFILGTIRASGT